MIRHILLKLIELNLFIEKILISILISMKKQIRFDKF